MAARRPASLELTPVGLPALRQLIERFIAVGFSKFVVRPVVPPASWRAELGRPRLGRRRPSDLTSTVLRYLPDSPRRKPTGNAARIVQRPEIRSRARGEAQAEAPGAPAGAGGRRARSSPATSRAPSPPPSALQRATGARSPSTRCCRSGTSATSAAPPMTISGSTSSRRTSRRSSGETWDVFHARVDRAWEAVRALAAATER